MISYSEWEAIRKHNYWSTEMILVSSSFARELHQRDNVLPRRPSWYTGHSVPGHWSTEHKSTKPPSALSQSTQLSGSRSRAPVSCQSCQHQTYTPAHTFRKDVQPPSHLSDVSALWGIMRKIKHITSITPLTHFYWAPSTTAAKPFPGLLRYPSASQDTAEF